MAYDLLAQSGRTGVSPLLLALVDDAVFLRLDSAEVSGLDAAIKTWQDLANGAGITTVRHRIIGSLQERTMLIDTGNVQLTVRSPDGKAQYDTLLAFKGVWNVGKAGWRLGLEEMKPLPPPPVAK